MVYGGTPLLATAVIKPVEVNGQVGLLDILLKDNGNGGAVTEKSSTAKSFPTALVLLLKSFILAQAELAMKVITTCCQPEAVGGAVGLPETRVTELALRISTPITAGVGVPGTLP